MSKIVRSTRAGCILVNTENKILCVHNVASGMWGFPKGHRKQGELPLDAALRELKEETGVVMDPGIISAEFESRKDRLYFAKGRFDAECTVDGTEIDEYAWLTLDNLRSRRTSKFTQKFFSRIKTALQTNNKIKIIH